LQLVPELLQVKKYTIFRAKTIFPLTHHAHTSLGQRILQTIIEPFSSLESKG